MNRTDLEMLAKCCSERTNYMNLLLETQNRYNNDLKVINRKLYRFGPVWCFTWRILSLLLIIFVEFNMFIPTSRIRLFFYYTEDLVVFLLLILFILIFIFLIIKSCVCLSHIGKKSDAQKDIVEAEELIKKYKDLINQRSEYIASCNFLPQQYCSVGHLIIQYILNCRADTLKEAINLFEFERQQNMYFRQQMDAINNVNNQLVKNGAMNALGMAMISTAILTK